METGGKFRKLQPALDISQNLEKLLSSETGSGSPIQSRLPILNVELVSAILILPILLQNSASVESPFFNTFDVFNM